MMAKMRVGCCRRGSCDARGVAHGRGAGVSREHMLAGAKAAARGGGEKAMARWGERGGESGKPVCVYGGWQCMTAGRRRCRYRLRVPDPIAARVYGLHVHPRQGRPVRGGLGPRLRLGYRA